MIESSSLEYGFHVMLWLLVNPPSTLKKFFNSANKLGKKFFPIQYHLNQRKRVFHHGKLPKDILQIPTKIFNKPFAHSSITSHWILRKSSFEHSKL